MDRAPREREGERAIQRLRKRESEEVRKNLPGNRCLVSIKFLLPAKTKRAIQPLPRKPVNKTLPNQTPEDPTKTRHLARLCLHGASALSAHQTLAASVQARMLWCVCAGAQALTYPSTQMHPHAHIQTRVHTWTSTHTVVHSEVFISMCLHPLQNMMRTYMHGYFLTNIHM